MHASNEKRCRSSSGVVKKTLSATTAEITRCRTAEKRPETRKSKRFDHVTSVVSRFMKTGISEPRRVKSVPVFIPEPFRNENKKYRDVKSPVALYIAKPKKQNGSGDGRAKVPNRKPLSKTTEQKLFVVPERREVGILSKFECAEKQTQTDPKIEDLVYELDFSRFQDQIRFLGLFCVFLLLAYFFL